MLLLTCYRLVESLYFTLLLGSLPKLTSFRFSYGILLIKVILKVYFFYILYSTYDYDSFSFYKFHLMVITANILVHPNKK